MNKALLLTFLSFCSIGAFAGDQCQIITKEHTYKESKELTFTNQLANKLTFTVPQPNKMIYDISSPILIYNKDKYIGYQMFDKPLYKKTAKQLVDEWGFVCDTPVIELTINDYQVLILDSQGLNSAFKSVFIIPKSNNYFYLLSFKGFTVQDFNNIIATLKQGA